ncbi:ECF RNA polymerase sigma factor SigK [Arthrobacter sp. StoSoilB3]|uniref:ECF RNA polymerase sigma factor SigK n=1 Tax=Paenarthrobacter TaxID=1742992 RepID=UPI001186AA5F|nr:MULTISPECIES: ECF RNA polymerase sigma factor SigK [unclassified Paenarthrobacter]BCW11368.1 ECF RNA polymerase sigma factor SigK [Arthrobacter sp. NtRootA2]BCW15452.1 ECF RNA polymerase sigma factor SigK [Arthrobacter sp. NtRootA4]BCW23787.1 ECF RNA polymerase sigma factor SigK [Arthrobacter sp. NtRootC7]BCW28054.1 ECF RNA polymerase sigma factor SigK [Arthrobacter sp. NtRootC45]BCW32324.1 ECF RNA polymerase sigma factor SigK [Arthrobacter sp. NtRootD5]BCW41209.1 ECF RNA polymerase sigma 
MSALQTRALTQHGHIAAPATRPRSAAGFRRDNICWTVMDTPNNPGPPVFEATSTATDLNTQLTGLLELVAARDQQAFAEFYALTSRRVFGMARRVLIDPDLSEDATQEVYIQVWQGAANFDRSAGTPLAWLMTIAHRRAIDRVRAVQAATDREARYGAASQDLDRDLVAEEADSNLEAEAVSRCLGTLTDTQRESVRLAYYGGLTYREVAEHLGAAVPTIKSRIRDGLLRLKTCLGVG